MSTLEFRTIAAADLSDGMLLALNNAHARELSWLEEDQFAHLVGQAFAAWQVEDAAALLLAFDEAADYRSPNYLWFRERYEKFVYVDRVVVAAAARGRGMARALYTALFQYAAQAGHERVVCEVNADPPNPASDAFHAAMGFAEVGHAAIYGGERTVRYFAKSLIGATDGGGREEA